MMKAWVRFPALAVLAMSWVACGEAEVTSSNCAEGCPVGTTCTPDGCLSEDWTPSPNAQLTSQWEEVEGLGSGLSTEKLPWGETASAYTFCGVQGYSNLGKELVLTPETKYGPPYQCTEYALRFICQVYNPAGCRTLGKQGSFGNAGQWYDNEKNHYVLSLLERHPNGGTVRPQRGDILASKSGSVGHVAIIRDVGENYVTIIEQNVSQSEADAARPLVMRVNNGRYTIPGVQGWMRVPGAQPACSDPRPSLITPGSGAVIESNQPVSFTWALGLADASHTLRVRNLDTQEVSEFEVGTSTSKSVNNLVVGSYRWTVFYRSESCAAPDEEGRCSADAQTFQVTAGAPTCDVNACRFRSRPSGSLCDNDQLVSCGTQGGCEVELSRQACTLPQRCSESGQSASCTTTCIPNASRQCQGNAVYEFDSCGTRGALVRSCGPNETCPDGDVPSDRCVSSCTPNASRACSNGDVYNYDSCNNRGSLAQSCSYGCANGQCQQQSCQPRSCADVGAQCGSVSDGCGNTLRCGSCSGSETCQNNRCVCSPQDVCQLASPAYRAATSAEFDGGGGEVMRLRVTSTSDCNRLRFTLDKSSGSLGSGDYSLRVGTCKSFGQVRASRTLNASASSITFETDHRGAPGETKIFCVTKNDPAAPYAASGWFRSNVAQIEMTTSC